MRSLLNHISDLNSLNWTILIDYWIWCGFVLVVYFDYPNLLLNSLSSVREKLFKFCTSSLSDWSNPNSEV